MKKYDLIFISTFIDTKMIGELLQCVAKNHDLRLCVVLVAQNGIRIDTAPYASTHTEFHVISVPGQLNLSAGRNVGIDYVVDNGITSAYVMFPDDDSSFDETFFLNFQKETSGGGALLIDVYEKGSRIKYIKNSFAPGVRITKKHYLAVGSTNIIIPYNLFLQIGLFDENVGVGAKYGAGEDGDYFFRSLQFVPHYTYTPNLYNFHPASGKKYVNMTFEQLKKRFKNYGEGGIYVLCKYGLYVGATCMVFRALGGGMIYALKLNSKMSTLYFYAFGCRIKTFFKCILQKA